MSAKVLSYRKTRNKKRTILCADESNSRLFKVLAAANEAKFPVMLADSAASCVSLCAAYSPDVVLLDESLCYVDEWSIPELLHLVCAKSVVLLTVEDPGKWQQLPPYVRAVAKRTDPDNVITVLRKVVGERG